MSNDQLERFISALHYAFVSPNVMDSNWEPANLVDVGNKIGSGLYAIAKAIDRHTDMLQEAQGDG